MFKIGPKIDQNRPKNVENQLLRCVTFFQGKNGKIKNLLQKTHELANKVEPFELIYCTVYGIVHTLYSTYHTE